MNIDVTVCTYNSEKYLKQCLASIKRNVPVKTLWIVDNCSSDRTVKIAESFGANIIKSKGSCILIVRGELFERDGKTRGFFTQKACPKR